MLGITCFQIRSDTEQIPIRYRVDTEQIPIKIADYWLGEG